MAKQFGFLMNKKARRRSRKSAAGWLKLADREDRAGRDASVCRHMADMSFRQTWSRRRRRKLKNKSPAAH